MYPLFSVFCPQYFCLCIFISIFAPTHIYTSQPVVVGNNPNTQLGVLTCTWDEKTLLTYFEEIKPTLGCTDLGFSNQMAPNFVGFTHLKLVHPVG